MKVLLINNNPVVGKLVTLSAQKTGDELIQTSSIDEISGGKYDLLIMDDASYKSDTFEALQAKVSFIQSCYIGSRDSQKPDNFTMELNKPFLPTDLVDIFMEISSNIADNSYSDALEKDDVLESLGLDDELEELEGLDLNDDIVDLESFDDDIEDKEEESLDDIEGIDEVEADSSIVKLDEISDSVLDEEDVKEVQNLLEDVVEEDEFENMDLSNEDEFNEDTGKSLLANEDTLNEISQALNEIDNEEAISLDDALEELSHEDDQDLEELSEMEDIDKENSDNLINEEPEEEKDELEDTLDDMIDEEDTLDEASALEDIEEDALDSIDDDELDNLINEEPEEEKDELEDTLDDMIDEEDTLDEASALEDIEEDALDSIDDDELDNLINEEPEEEKDELEDTLDDMIDEEDTLDEVSALEDTNDLEGSSYEDTSKIDLGAINEEIEEALGNLDEDDLLSEIDEMGYEEDLLGGDIAEESIEDEFSSINVKDLKLVLGEIDEEEASIQDEIEELENSLEKEEEIDFSVGDSEYASLNEEALNEAMYDGIEIDGEHPELDDVDAFVDEIPVDGKGSTSINVSSNEGITSLEKLINTLKQDNVKETLKGMNMTISISFNEKDS